MPTWKAIHLGQIGTVLDPTEGNSTAENAGLLVGQTFGTVGDPLRQHLVDVTTINNGGDPAALESDNTIANDAVSYDLGAGTQTVTFDTGVVYNATITYVDGTTANVTAVVFQDISGNLFLAPELSGNADTAAYEAKPIRSLSLNSVNDDTINLGANRYATAFLCLAAGTLILTPDGERQVETLRDRDEVFTLDRGTRRIQLMVDSPAEDMAGQGVLIRAGALGPARPQRDLVVSRQHRVLIAAPLVRRMFGTSEVLVPAFRLIGLPGIEVAGDVVTTYWNLMMGRHEVLIANGAPVESLLPGPMTLSVLGADGKRRLQARKPSLCRTGAGEVTARLVPAPAAQKELVDRLRRNRTQPLAGWSDPVADLYALFATG